MQPKSGHREIGQEIASNEGSMKAMIGKYMSYNSSKYESFYMLDQPQQARSRAWHSKNNVVELKVYVRPKWAIRQKWTVTIRSALIQSDPWLHQLAEK